MSPLVTGPVLATDAEVGLRRRQQWSTRVVFFIAGFVMASWAPLVPFAQARTELGTGPLGLLLLGLGVGSIVAMPLSGVLAARFGCRRVLIASTVVLCAALPFVATLSAAVALGAALLVFGAGVGTVDCVANIQAVVVERDSGRPMMSGFHGLFSLGGILGAGGVSALLSLGLTPLAAVLCVVAVTVAALGIAAPGLLPQASAGGGPVFAIPRGAVVVIGLLCFVVFLTEGSVLDWSAVFMTTVRGLAPRYGGLGYAAFAATMTLGRLAGDRIVRGVGRGRVVVVGSLCAAAGLAVATLVPAAPAALLGYALVGAGCSNIVPVLYTAAGRQAAMPEHIAIPAVTMLGYAGILAGPALIGLVANVSSLQAAFLAVAAALLAVAVVGPRSLRGDAR